MSKAAGGPMRGRVCVVTGGSSGVGLATAMGLAGLGATVLLVSRDPRSGERAAEAIRRRTGNAEVRFLACDLSLQREVRRLAREVAERHRELHVWPTAPVTCPCGASSQRRESSAPWPWTTSATSCSPCACSSRFTRGALPE